MSRSSSVLIEILDQGYDRKAWHGPNLRNSLQGVSPEIAAWRPAPGRHNIWEIAVHAAYWKYRVRRKLCGDITRSFALKGSNWFKRPEELTAKAWRADLALLESEHRKLRKALADHLAGKTPRIPSRFLFERRSTMFTTRAKSAFCAGCMGELRQGRIYHATQEKEYFPSSLGRTQENSELNRRQNPVYNFPAPTLE